MGKHLTFYERRIIEDGLNHHESFAEIARKVGKDRSTVSREIKARPQFCKPRGTVCRNRKHCNQKDHCTYESCKLIQCRFNCPKCHENCPNFDEIKCEKVDLYPYGCNGCLKTSCQYARKVYSSRHAQYLYERDLSESRKGISLSDEDFEFLDEKVVSKLHAGQSIHVIHQNNIDEMPVSERTIYSYMQHGLFSTDKLVLRRTVQRKARRKSGPVLRVDKHCHVGRCYEDYQAYLMEHPEKTVQQMDSVIGRKGGKCLLTILFTNCDLQLMFLRDRNTSKSVSEVFQDLRVSLGDEDFRKLFQVILTDRGCEFTDPSKIEADNGTGELQCRLFYCDPQQSNQKSNCERNHEFIRYVIPKKTSMDDLDQEKVALMMNHINSYPREKWNNRSPIDVFVSIYGDQIAAKLGLVKIDADAVVLRPQLIR